MARRKGDTFNRRTGLERGNGWVEQAASGRWRARPGHGQPSLGTFATKQEAIAALTAVVVPTSDVTVADYIAQFIRLRGTRWEARTRANYQWYAERKINAAIGHLRLDEIDQQVINEWWIHLSEATGTLRNGDTTSGRATCAKVWKFLRQVLKAADTDGLIVHPIGPPVEGASREHNPERVLLTDTQVDAIIANLPPQRRIVAILAAYAGLRWGEIIGLCRQHIDTTNNVLSVQEVISEDNTTAVRTKKEPKTTASRRAVPVDQSVMAAVVEHLNRHVTDPGPHAALVTTTNGTPVSRSTWGQQWRRAVRQAGLDGLRPAITIHDLRHYCLTNASRQTGQLREVMKFAGHSTATAAMRYQHLAGTELSHLARPLRSEPHQEG